MTLDPTARMTPQDLASGIAARTPQGLSELDELAGHAFNCSAQAAALDLCEMGAAINSIGVKLRAVQADLERDFAARTLRELMADEFGPVAAAVVLRLAREAAADLQNLRVDDEGQGLLVLNRRTGGGLFRNRVAFFYSHDQGQTLVRRRLRQATCELAESIAVEQRLSEGDVQ